MVMRGQYYFLSNMYPCRVEYNGHVFKCSEAAFQAQKDLSKVSSFEKADGYKAKSLGGYRSGIVKLRPDWEEVKVDIMRDVLRAKFSDPVLAKKLISVEGEIAEDNDHGDRTWGRVNGTGKNLLGKLLMEVRDEKIKELSKSDEASLKLPRKTETADEERDLLSLDEVIEDESSFETLFK